MFPAARLSPDLSPHTLIHGRVSTGFEGVREAFAENFRSRHELGGACCAYYHGEKVVDLWGGLRNKQSGEPWEEDTMVIVYSATKGLAAMTMALAHSRGWLYYDDPVAAFGQPMPQRHALGFANHLLEARHVSRPHRMRAP